MAMTTKFALFNLNEGGFVKEDGTCAKEDKLDLLSGAIFTEETAKERGITLKEEDYLVIPMSRVTYDGLPDTDIMKDTAKEVPFNDVDPEAKNAALENDFIILHPEGFYDEKKVFAGKPEEYSHSAIRGYDLDYANLYTMDDLKRTGQEWLIEEPDVVIPVSEAQQEKLKQFPEFTEENGFFMKPVGGYQNVGKEKEGLPELGDALADLETETKGLELPWDV